MPTVFINGCFDLLHVGHVRFIRFAQSLGDRLIAGINSDDYIRHRKGPSRPIITESHRKEMLYAVGVDEVVIFDDPLPYDVIVARRPDVYCIGVDYSDDDDSCKHVRSYGGRVVRYTVRDESTTELLERIIS